MLDFNFWTILFSVINILVLFLFLKKFLFGRINAILDQRAAIVRADLDHAKEASEEAEQMRAEYEATMQNAKEEAKQLLIQTQKTANAQHAAATQQAQEEASRIIEDAQREIALERERSIASAQSEIAGLALEAAAKIVGKEMDTQANRDLVDAFLEEEGDPA
jgi:F-type H+-transporting ATPase subunit b